MNTNHHDQSPAEDEARDLFASISDVDPETTARLHAALIAAASADGLLDIAYRTIDTPVGPLLLAATDKGLVRVAYEREGHDRVLETLANRISPRILRAPERLDKVARELDQYFAGTRKRFEIPLDTRLSSGFRRDVLSHLPEISYGKTASYADIAQLVNNPKAVRAVGSACATNPLPVVIPCHRVVRSDGGLSGYVGGVDAKRALLALESAA
jgi:methylated-DNA-[protein]-cysteine S-methyltransferase